MASISAMDVLLVGDFCGSDTENKRKLWDVIVRD